MILIDAYSQIFRGFYAIAALSDRQGAPTNAIFATAKFLLKLEREYPSAHGAAVFDCGRVQFRQALNPVYKANRPPTPEALSAQIPALRELFTAFGWPLLEEPEYEADDLIAALAVHHADAVQIISADKDLAQLIDARVTMLIPAMGGGFETRDAAKVRTRFGVEPGQMIDYLALLGDASDNIEGVHGVGPKTAEKILAEVGSLGAFFAAPECLKNEKLRALLLDSAELLRRNDALIRLRRDLPARLTAPDVVRRATPDRERLIAFCAARDLNSIVRELKKDAPPAWVQGELF